MRWLTLAALICSVTSAWAQKSPPTSLGALLDGSGFVKIPPGEFVMGSKAGNTDEQPPHKVRISKGFEIGKYEVTQAQWEAIMSDPHAKPTPDDPMPEEVNPSKFPGADRPVENITWNAVQQFLRTINKRDPKHVYRLPTEAEWEYAARAGSVEDNPKNVEAAAWFKPNSGEETHPVGQKAPNAWGLYDIYGNVREWVQDWYTCLGRRGLVHGSGLRHPRPLRGAQSRLRTPHSRLPAGPEEPSGQRCRKRVRQAERALLLAGREAALCGR